MIRALLLALAAAAPLRAESDFDRLMKRAWEVKATPDGPAAFDAAAKAWKPSDEKDGRLRAVFNRGVSERYLGRFDEAIRTFGEVLKVEPSHGWARYYRGSLLAGAGRVDEGVEDLLLSARSKEVRGPSETDLCFFLAAKADFAKALPHCELAPAGEPSRQNHLNLAWVRAELGRKKEAKTALLAARAKAAEPDPDPDTSLDSQDLYVSAVIGHDKDWERAAVDLVEFQPKNARRVAWLARARLKKGRLEEGLAGLDRAIALAGEKASGIYRFDKARALAAAGRHAEAKAELKKSCAAGWRPACPRKS